MSRILIVLAFAISAAADPTTKQANLDRAWSIVKGAVADSHPDRRARAVRSLALAPNNTEIRVIAQKALSDSSPDVRTEAATVLGQLRDRDAIPMLKNALKDSDLKVVLAAANALYILKDASAYDVYYAIVTGQRKSSNGLIQSQLDLLHNRKYMEKLAFETGIGFVPFGSMAFEAWKTITQNDSAAVVAQALERLATDPDPKSQQALEDACYDTKWQVRAAAVAGLAKRGNPSALDYAVSAMHDDNDLVVDEAAVTVIYLSGRPIAHDRATAHRTARLDSTTDSN